MPDPGRRLTFVALDGPNRVGKSSAMAALRDLVQARGVPFTAVRQPSDTELGQFIRRGEASYRGLTLAALVVADRVLLVDQVIRPALAGRHVVVTDRHIGSTLALQRVDGVDLDVLWELNSGVLVPDLSVFLSAPAWVLEKRLNDRGRTSRFEHTDGISETESQFLQRQRTSWSTRVPGFCGSLPSTVMQRLSLPASTKPSGSSRPRACNS